MFGTLNGPVGEPHQLHSALTVPVWLIGSTVSPVRAKLVGPMTPMLFSLLTTPELGIIGGTIALNRIA